MSTSHAQGPSRRRWLVLLLGLAITGGGGAVALALGLVTPGWLGSLYPPCEDLPSMADVTDALERHAAFVEELEAIGPDVRVRAENPCDDGQDRAVVNVYHRTAGQQEVIDDLFARSEPLGVPARPVRGRGAPS